MGCFNNCGNNSCWIIILLLLACGGNGCDNNCGNDCNWIFIILLLLLFCGGTNNNCIGNCGGNNGCGGCGC